MYKLSNIKCQIFNYITKIVIFWIKSKITSAAKQLSCRGKNERKKQVQHNRVKREERMVVCIQSYNFCVFDDEISGRFFDIIDHYQ
jgi:hypothetical protein